MVPTTSGEAFAAANAAMVRGDDGASTVHVLLADCVALLGAKTAGVLVQVGEQGLEMLAATSHQAAELELYQSQVHDGPCVEAIERATGITVVGTQALEERWPSFGRAMSAAGLQTVHAEPMRWHRRVLGGVNLFWSSAHDLTDAEKGMAHAFADICTLALMQSGIHDDSAAIPEQVRVALQGRVVIERAKGVLAQLDGVEMDEAFARLVQRSRETERPLASVAQQMLDDVVGRSRT
jgi:hypothetical protein